MKINIIRIILIILLACTFCIIFGFSSQDSKQSAGLSEKITKILTDKINYIQQKPKTEKEKIINRIESVIRKLAHFGIYTVVGILLMSLVSTYKMKELDRISISLIIGVIYAGSDEIHQCFTPGRGPMVTDVILDGMGVLLGIFLVMLCIKIFQKINNKKLIKDL